MSPREVFNIIEHTITDFLEVKSEQYAFSYEGRIDLLTIIESFLINLEEANEITKWSSSTTFMATHGSDSTFLIIVDCVSRGIFDQETFTLRSEEDPIKDYDRAMSIL